MNRLHFSGIGWLRTLNARLRFFVSLLLGLITFHFLPVWIRPEIRIVVAWDVGVLVFLLLAWSIMWLATARQTEHSTLSQDQSGVAILSVVVAAASASFFAIVYILRFSKGAPPQDEIFRIIVSAIAVICAWLTVHTVFALHYAHRFYRFKGGDFRDDAARGLAFPGNDQPTYMDFAYFSFVIGMTSQVSDVQVTNSVMRRLALVHGVLSFIYNTFIFALTVNLLAGLM